MPRRTSTALFSAALLLTTAQAAPPTNKELVIVRTGSHPDFGRIVFDAPQNARYALARDGDVVIVRFPDTVSLGTPEAPPRNVLRLTASGTRAEFSVAAGATLRQNSVRRTYRC